MKDEEHATLLGHSPERETSRAVMRAWGEWLARYAWHHYATLTFRWATAPERAVREFLDGWIRRLTRAAQQPVPWFYALEASGGDPHAVHLHALVAGTAQLPVARLERAWTRGNTRILRYDPARGAAWYVSKSLGRAPDRYDLSRRRPPLLADARAAA